MILQLQGGAVVGFVCFVFSLFLTLDWRGWAGVFLGDSLAWIKWFLCACIQQTFKGV